MKKEVSDVVDAGSGQRPLPADAAGQDRHAVAIELRLLPDVMKHMGAKDATYKIANLTISL
eukprot:3953465-Heterocapsa_arctica.AAC.1